MGHLRVSFIDAEIALKRLFVMAFKAIAASDTLIWY
jgi:hypothetical protein